MKSSALIGVTVGLFLFACISIALIGCSASVMDSARIGVAAEPNSMAKREPGAIAPSRPDAERARPPAAPPGGGPSLDEEVWVIAKSDAQQQADDDDVPGSGALVTKIDGQEKHVPVPLKHTEVQANIDGYIASVNVKQQFHNPFSEKIEALYVFPLPQNAAVNEFVMTVGDRKIRGIIRERQEAEKIYQEARRQGYVASLMTQERANIFTQRVANIEPGKQIEIDVKYFNTMSYRDGWYEFVFPMVVGPRYNPPSNGDAGVGAVGRNARGQSGQKVEVQYLKPKERSGHDISLTANINAGVAIEAIQCSSHQVEASPIEPAANGKSNRAAVQLDRRDRIPNKDFVLRWRVAGDRIKSAFVVHEDKRGKFFSLMLYPPAEIKSLPRQSMEMVFVLDCSGSMNGQPMAQSKAAMQQALQRLKQGDSFQVIRFSSDASQLGPKPLEINRSSVRRALAYVKTLKGRGGTRMIEGIKASLDFPHDERRHRVVTFLTDGYIGNERRVLGAVNEKIGNARIFSFGVGSSPNRYLMNRMAKIGRGAVAYLSLRDDAGKVMDDYFNRISHPAMTDLEIDWGGLKVESVYPRRIPDLFVGRPVILTGRFKGEAKGAITVKGRAGDQDVTEKVQIDVDGKVARNSALAAVWARMQIADLMDQSTFTNDPHNELPNEIKRVALEYGLMSSYTAFLAVDSQTRTDGDHGTTVAIPVPVPEGVRYDTTVQE